MKFNHKAIITTLFHVSQSYQFKEAVDWFGGETTLCKENDIFGIKEKEKLICRKQLVIWQVI